MAGEFQIYGFQGELRGNERRLQRRLPLFFRIGDERHVYVPRVLDWAPLLLKNDILRVPVEEASEYGEYVDLQQPVESGEYVVVMGPEWVKATELMGILTEELSQQVDGFAYMVTIEPFVDVIIEVADRLARQLFDSEIAAGAVSDRARAALTVMWGISSPDYRGVVVRDLAGAYVARDPDRFRRLLRIAAARLDDDVRLIKAEVLDYIAVVQGNRTLLERAESEAAVTADVPAR